MKLTPRKTLLGFIILAFIFNSCFKDDLLKEIDSLKTQVSDMKKRNDSLNNLLNVRADSLSKALSNAQKRSDSLANVLRTKSDSLSLALGITNANLANLTKSVDSIKTQIASISGQLTQLNLQLTSITSQLTQLNQQLGAIGGDVSQLAAHYQALSASLQTINTQIAALQAEQLKLLEKLNAILLQLNPPIDLTTGLVAYYPFNGNANDESANSVKLNGVVNGPILTTDRFNKDNSAYLFDNNNITVLHDTRLNASNNFTVSLWIYSLKDEVGDIIMKGLGDKSTYTWFLRYHSTLFIDPNINFAFQQATTVDPQSLKQVRASTPQINNWTHIAAVIDGTSIKIYKNGVLSNTTLNVDLSNVNLNQDAMKIGTTQYAFNGKIDDVRIYNRVLTQSEISYLAKN